jgi:hypothetical protein
MNVQHAAFLVELDSRANLPTLAISLNKLEDAVRDLQRF